MVGGVLGWSPGLSFCLAAAEKNSISRKTFEKADGTCDFAGLLAPLLRVRNQGTVLLLQQDSAINNRCPVVLSEVDCATYNCSFCKMHTVNILSMIPAAILLCYSLYFRGKLSF